MKGQYHSIEEVLSVAQRLTGKSLRDIVPNNVEVTPGNKGAFGLLLEEHGFGVANNNSQAPDFQPVGVELKVVPLKNKGRSWDVKERTKICSINYHSLVEEDWESSHCKNKLDHVLFVFYRHCDDLMDCKVEGHLLYQLSDRREAPLLRKDWELIWAKVCSGHADSLSESLTSRLAASTAGAKANDVSQPFSSKGARKRAFSLKPSYTRTLRAEFLQKKKFDSVLDLPSYKEGMDIAEFLLGCLHRFEGRLIADIATELGVPIKGGKASNAGFVRRMLGFASGKGHVREIAECGITLRVVPVNPKTGKLWEAVSFPHQTLQEIAEEESFEESALCAATESMLVVPIYRGRKASDEGARLGRAHFWQPDAEALQAMIEEWALCRQRILNAVEQRRTDLMLPSELLPSTETLVAHFRPHARDSKDLEDSCGFPIVKSSFWLNRDAVVIPG